MTRRDVVTVNDIERIPEILDPRNIFTFVVENGMPRMGYRRQYEDRTLIVVVEIRSRGGLALKTVYWEK